LRLLTGGPEPGSTGEIARLFQAAHDEEPGLVEGVEGCGWIAQGWPDKARCYTEGIAADRGCVLFRARRAHVYVDWACSDRHAGRDSRERWLAALADFEALLRQDSNAPQVRGWVERLRKLLGK